MTMDGKGAAWRRVVMAAAAALMLTGGLSGCGGAEKATPQAVETAPSGTPVPPGSGGTYESHAKTAAPGASSAPSIPPPGGPR